MSAEARLKELGIVLPALPKPVANYLPYRLAGNILYLAGQGPRDANGAHLTGKLGAEISIEEGYRRARLVGLGLLAAMRDALGSLDRVDYIVKLLGMVKRGAGVQRLAQDHQWLLGSFRRNIRRSRSSCPLRRRQCHAAQSDFSGDRGHRRGQGVAQG